MFRSVYYSSVFVLLTCINRKLNHVVSLVRLVFVYHYPAGTMKFFLMKIVPVLLRNSNRRTNLILFGPLFSEFLNDH